jgi:PAS domain S-box-containing protein
MLRSDSMTWRPSPKWAVAALAVVIILTIVVGTLVVLSELRQGTLGRVRSEVRGLSEVLAEQSSRAFEGAEVALLATQYRLSDTIGQSLSLASFPVSALLGARAAGLPQIRSMFVIDATGQTVNTSLPSGPPQGSLADRDYFRYFQHGGEDVYISDPVRSRADGKWTLIIAARLLDAQDNFRGVLAVSLSTDYFDAFYQGLESVDRFRIMLIRANSGKLLASPTDQPLIGSAIPGLPTDLSAPSRSGLREVTEQYDGASRFVTYKPVPGYPFLISVAVDEAVALRDWPQTVRPIASFAVAVVVCILVAAGGLMWSLHRRELMARALHESDARGRQLIQTVNDAIVMLDQQLSIVLFNPAAESLFGISAANAIGTPFECLLQPSAREACIRLLGRCAAEGEGVDPCPRQSEIDCQHRCGQTFAADASFSTTLFRGERVFSVVLRDLSERRRIEADLRASNDRLQALSVAMQRVREEERTLIAREMHDELGQLLTGIKLEFSWLRGRLPPEREDLRDKVALIQAQLGETVSSVRRITYQLRPLILDDLGLNAAVAWMVGEFTQRTGVEVVLDAASEEPPHGSAEATTLFRLLQESLTNVMKYAQASTVWVTFRADAESWRMSVRDDGVGFDLGAVAKDCFGLIGMRERARLSGGTCEIVSAPGEGVHIEVCLPFANEEMKRQ